MDAAKKNKVLEVLNYWELMEFLEQNNIEYQEGNAETAIYELIRNNDPKPIEKFKSLNIYHYFGEKLAAGLNAADFFAVSKSVDEKFNEDIEKIKSTRLAAVLSEDEEIFKAFPNADSEFEFNIGNIPRNNIVEYLKKYLPEEERELEEMLPELPYQDGEAIAWFVFKTDGKGNYIEKSFELSPILWALAEWENNSGAENRFELDAREFKAIVKKFKERILCEGAKPPKIMRLDDFLPVLYKLVFDEYVRKLFPKALDEQRHIGFFRYERRRKTEGDSSKFSGKLLSNSFYLDDIAKLKEMIEKDKFDDSSDYKRSVINYILSAEYKRSNTEIAERVSISPKEDINHSFKLFTKLLNINNAPNGKWPAHFKSSLMQQTAVNLAIAEDGKTPIFSVNGPPGTGKTTLLKDVLANSIVERAYLLAESAKDEPDSIFEMRKFRKGPLEAKDHAYLESAPHYFSIKEEYDKINDYGMLVASCNNSAVENITVDLPKLDDLLKALVKRDDDKNDISPPELREIHDLFDPDKDNGVLFAKYSDNLLNSDSGKNKDDDAKIRSWGLISAPLGKSENIKSYCEAVLKPFLKDHSSAEARSEHLAKYREMRKRFLEQYAYVGILKDELEKMCEECGSNPDTFVLPEKYNGKMSVIDKDFMYDYISDDEKKSTEAQLSNPWATDKLNRERERLFFYAYRLHEEFVAASDCMRQNMENLLVVWGRHDKAFIKREDWEDKKTPFPVLLQSLFLITPVVSTTFASVGRFLYFAKHPETIGMLIVDEAGQAPPHVAVGALYRARKAVIVGDPKQIEPVVTAETDMFKRIMTSEVLAPYKDKRLSVQGFADNLNPYGTYLGQGSEREWVGCPLVVHRRCTDPMYSISNVLSYDGTMKNKDKEPEEGEYILTRSCWINVTGKETGNKNHYVKEQGMVVLKLLEAMLNKTGKLDNLYIISPFTSAARGVKTEINKSDLGEDKRVKDWLNGNNIGTVHTFQGKGTDEVIFLLGCDKTSTSAANWVNKNIVNVAATRAKKRFYIIGDTEVWSGCEPVAIAKNTLLEKGGEELTASELEALLPKKTAPQAENPPAPQAESRPAVKAPASQPAPRATEQRPAPQGNNALPRYLMCPKCGSELREFTRKADGKKFWSCSNYKSCDFKPKCPKCGKWLTIQQNKKDGTYFWGCTGFRTTGCRFTCSDFTKFT